MNKIHIVLIGDDELNRKNLRIILQQHNDIIWTGEATNGQEGLKLLWEKKPDVAIIDLALTEIDNIELTKRYKTNHKEESATKILILSLNKERQKVLAAFNAGADSYCLKDIKIDLLIEALKATYRGHVWLDPVIARIILSQVKNNACVSYTAHANQAISSQELIHHSPLTERELEVLKLIVDGQSNAEISQQLYITVGTVKTHVRNILNKLCADDRTQAAVRALRSGLVG